MSFGKIFECTFTGSMAGSGPTVFAVWAYVIANTKPPGIVEINPLLLSAIIGTDIEDVERALVVLTSPDARSRSKAHDGRRLLQIGEFAFEVPTWQSYRDARNDDERKAYNREAQRRHRASIAMSMTVNDSQDMSAQAEAEAEAEDKSSIRSRMEQALEIYNSYPRKIGKDAAIRKILKSLQLISFDTLLKTVRSYAAAVAGKDKQFIPHPATWFGQGRYEDDQSEWSASNSKPSVRAKV